MATALQAVLFLRLCRHRNEQRFFHVCAQQKTRFAKWNLSRKTVHEINKTWSSKLVQCPLAARLKLSSDVRVEGCYNWQRCESVEKSATSLWCKEKLFFVSLLFDCFACFAKNTRRRAFPTQFLNLHRKSINKSARWAFFKEPRHDTAWGSLNEHMRDKEKHQRDRRLANYFELNEPFMTCLRLFPELLTPTSDIRRHHADYKDQKTEKSSWEVV